MTDDTALTSRYFQDWQALLAACRVTHGKGPGGAAMCVCGAPCGGSAACSMVAMLRNLIRYFPDENIPDNLRPMFTALRRVI